MIISASRRSDIPACLSDWLIEHIERGAVTVTNPYNRRQRTVSLDPSCVDELVLWSKHPAPLLQKMDRLASYRCRLLMTLNAYPRSIEPLVPILATRIETFRAFSALLGPEFTIWRYDPVLISAEHSVSRHQEAFSMLCEALTGFTKTCIISFLDIYPKRRKALASRGIRPPDADEVTAFAQTAAQAAAQAGIRIQTCCEDGDLSAYGIIPGACIPGRVKDRGQRPGCLCAQSIDIGSYGSCSLGCIYCYA